jgi:hypothetical protein
MFFVLLISSFITVSCSKSAEEGIYRKVDMPSPTVDPVKSRGAELDLAIYEEMVKATLVDAFVKCKKMEMSESECESLKRADIETHRQENLGVVSSTNENCKIANESDEECNKRKENFIKKMKAVFK